MLRATGGNLDVQFLVGGTLTDPDGQTATVGVTRADGTVLKAPGTATARQSVGVYRLVLAPADIPECAQLKATWAATFSAAADQVATYAEVVGDHLFTLAQARAFNPRSQVAAPLASAGSYPDDMVLDARNRIGDDFELICGTSFFPRYRRVTLDGSRTVPYVNALNRPDPKIANIAWSMALELPVHHVTRLLSVTVSGVAYDAPTLAGVVAYETGQLVKASLSPWEAGVQNIVVEAVYGYDRTPGMITRAALLLLVSQLAGTDISPRALTLADETGTMTLATAGMRGSYYGLPEVDSVLHRFAGDRIPGVA